MKFGKKEVRHRVLESSNDQGREQSRIFIVLPVACHASLGENAAILPKVDHDRMLAGAYCTAKCNNRRPVERLWIRGLKERLASAFGAPSRNIVLCVALTFAL